MSRVRAVLVGLGHRTACYASYALQHPEEMEVVGLADPDSDRLAIFAEKYGIPNDKCFSSSQELAAIPRFGDIAINGTMDEVHVETTIPLVEAGYHVLLEKPIAPNSSELNLLDAAVTKAGVKVAICHVLRYAPFYNDIQQRIVAGEIGEIIHIHSTENVSYHHMAVAFVRGKWNKRAVNPIMLAKCCHDLDLICWFNSGIKPSKISSMGGASFLHHQKRSRRCW
ncbi:Gfo/Idh/MocA family oxidoreductase [Euryarchaeota archaeon]|nr:Gfo/Idh/MocA family oxidoreductase [Euryarchaeota archaeon]